MLIIITELRFELKKTAPGKNRVPKGGSLEPWSPEISAVEPGARSFLLTGALIPFWLWSPEPKEILSGARSPAFSSLIIEFPAAIWHIALILDYCLFVFVCACERA